MKSKSDEVQRFMVELADGNPTMAEILRTLQQIVIAEVPEVSERIMYGGIMFSVEGKDWGGVFPYSNHVSFEFSRGVEINDPAGVLQGSGKLRRHVKFMSASDVSAVDVVGLVREATTLASQ